MNADHETHEHDDGLDGAVYGGLLALTALTLGASVLAHEGRLVAVTVALIIASAKAALILYYYMDLRRERFFFWLVPAIGVLAVLILLAGILPDLTFARF